MVACYAIFFLNKGELYVLIQHNIHKKKWNQKSSFQNNTYNNTYNREGLERVSQELFFTFELFCTV